MRLQSLEKTQQRELLQRKRLPESQKGGNTEEHHWWQPIYPIWNGKIQLAKWNKYIDARAKERKSSSKVSNKHL